MQLLTERLVFQKISKYYTLIALCAILFLIVLMHFISEKIYSISQENAKLTELISTQKSLFHQMHHYASYAGEHENGLEVDLKRIALLNEQWSQNHFAIQFGIGNAQSEKNKLIEEKFNEIQPYKDNISDAIKEFLLVVNNDRLRNEMIKKICAQEASFLVLMDDIEDAYLQENDGIIALLQKLNVSIFIITLALVVLLVFQQIKTRLQFALPAAMRSFFSDTLVEEYMQMQPTATKILAEKEIINLADTKKSIQRAEKLHLLIIKDSKIPIDYIAWFLNKCSLEFIIAKDIDAAQKAVLNAHFDVILMSEAMRRSLKYEAHNTAINIITQLPVVLLEASDISEIHAQIHKDESINPISSSFEKVALYQKILEKLSHKEISHD
ncbi:hypothetical protein WJR50_20885 [Catalinimonas sp. 4WD22]|uniref:hypothetical protein n=1 Tax=Catalinimonas locisalis TaxID=3133978 RepID=UPI003100B5BF